jgi:hypothetical protein
MRVRVRRLRLLKDEKMKLLFTITSILYAGNVLAAQQHYAIAQMY